MLSPLFKTQNDTSIVMSFILIHADEWEAGASPANVTSDTCDNTTLAEDWVFLEN